MKDALITSVATGDDGAGATVHVSIAYGEIEFGYRPLTPAGGLGASVTFDWNTKTGAVT
jgi:hypothetical protein